MSTPTYTPLALRRPGHEIGLDVQHAAPPVDAYVTQDDSLWIMVSSSSTLTIVTVVARILLPDATIVLNTWTVPTPNGRIGTYTQQRLPEGFILSVSATANLASSAAPAFVALYLSRSLPGSFQAAQLLAQGYTYNNQVVSWPGGINVNSTDNAGNIRAILGAVPAAGANIVETVPSNARWRLLAFSFQLATSVAVATRTVQFVVNVGGVIVSTVIAPITQAASLTIAYSLGQALNATAAGSGFGNWSFPSGLILPAAATFGTSVLSLQAADQLTAPSYLIEEWLIP